MNRLALERRAQILGMLTEGNSLRATSRMAGVSINTVSKLLVDVGEACETYQDQVMRDLPCKTVQVDEIWAYCYSKQKNVPEEHQGTFGYGDVWTFTAIDAETKLVPTWMVGERTIHDAIAFLADLKDRLAGRVQLTTDGLNVYLTAVSLSFGHEIDYAQLAKIYGTDPNAPRGRYSPAICTATRTRVFKGAPDPTKINTSYVERQNLTMRMGMRRFTRLTNAFSKKAENMAHAVSLHFMHYNFARPHRSLGRPYPRTPAMAAGIADHIWSMTDIARLAN